MRNDGCVLRRLKKRQVSERVFVGMATGSMRTQCRKKYTITVAEFTVHLVIVATHNILEVTVVAFYVTFFRWYELPVAGGSPTPLVG